MLNKVIKPNLEPRVLLLSPLFFATQLLLLQELCFELHSMVL